MFTRFIFFNSDQEVGYVYSFSTDLEKVGLEWDVRIKNGTYIEVLSEPLEIYRQKYGTISVIKVRADVADDYHTVIKEFWIPANHVMELKEDVSQSSQFRN